MKTDNTGNLEFRRSFLIKDLPKPLTPADSHQQIFDNYIESTAIHLRAIRIPKTNEWTKLLEKRIYLKDGENEGWKVSRLVLNDEEFEMFRSFEGREVRKNRYFYSVNDAKFEIDVFLGSLWGLTIAKIYFPTFDEVSTNKVPEFAIMEITKEEFFFGENLAGKDFSDVQEKFKKLKEAV